jgi:SAM-dependent methyltransferase
MPALSDYAQRKKIDYFLKPLPKDARILEVGCGSRWVGDYLRSNGWRNYVGADLVPPADIVGDIREWRSLGLKAGSFDVVIAFEVIEHVDLVQEAYDLLAPGGLLLLTSPVPHMDWAMKLLEALRLNQRRTSPHDHLVYFERIRLFEPVSLTRKAGLSQWGILRKPHAEAQLHAAA